MKVFLKNKIVSLNFVLGLMIGLVSFLGLSVLFNNHSVLAYSLTVSSSGAQSIDVAPKNGDTGTSINADSITVATDCRNGYDFAISASVNDNNLYLGGDSNNNSSNTFFAPSNGSTALKNAPNTWGYYFNASGLMKTGWLNDGSSWYYLGSDGKMRTGWAKDGNAWYYLGSDGKMRTSWTKDGNAWYYLGTDGKMRTGWTKDGSAWYYLGSDGKMQTGWVKDGSWYYMNSDGKMHMGWKSLNGKWYYFNTDGKMHTSWKAYII